MKQRKVIIALAQIKYFDICRRNNLEKIKKCIKQAAKREADIICFPESCLYKTQTLHFDDKIINEIKKECRKNSIWCIITEDLMLRGEPYNASILIDRKGVVKGNYKKIHLYGDDDINPGKKINVFKTDFGKIGIVICWDLAFPELFKRLKQKGAEIVFCPAQWKYELKAYGAKKYENKLKKREAKTLKSLIMTRAFENLYFIALCSPVMKAKDLVSYSAVVSPHKVIKELFDEEGLLVCELNLNEIKRLKKIYHPKNIS